MGSLLAAHVRHFPFHLLARAFNWMRQSWHRRLNMFWNIRPRLKTWQPAVTSLRTWPARAAVQVEKCGEVPPISQRFESPLRETCAWDTANPRAHLVSCKRHDPGKLLSISGSCRCSSKQVHILPQPHLNKKDQLNTRIPTQITPLELCSPVQWLLMAAILLTWRMFRASEK